VFLSLISETERTVADRSTSFYSLLARQARKRRGTGRGRVYRFSILPDDRINRRHLQSWAKLKICRPDPTVSGIY
jgi:hypothetical protein